MIDIVDGEPPLQARLGGPRLKAAAHRFAVKKAAEKRRRK
jgi:hypothetical protein